MGKRKKEDDAFLRKKMSHIILKYDLEVIQWYSTEICILEDPV